VDQVPNAVQRIVDESLGVSVKSCSIPKRGAVADTYVLTLADDRRVVCKIGGANMWTNDVVEPDIIRFVRRKTDLPVPTVLASGTVRGVDTPNRWGLYEFLPGEAPTVHARSSYERTVEEAGAALGRLHTAFDCDRIGELQRNKDGLWLASPPGWNLLHSSSVDRLSTVITSEASRRPVLAHGDYHPGNLLVDDGVITGLVDWGSAHVTRAGYSLARAETRFVDLVPVSTKPRLRDAFRDGYDRHAVLPPDYERVFWLYRWLWMVQSSINITRIVRTKRGRVQLTRQFRNWAGRQRARMDPRQ